MPSSPRRHRDWHDERRTARIIQPACLRLQLEREAPAEDRPRHATPVVLRVRHDRRQRTVERGEAGQRVDRTEERGTRLDARPSLLVDRPANLGRPRRRHADESVENFSEEITEDGARPAPSPLRLSHRRCISPIPGRIVRKKTLPPPKEAEVQVDSRRNDRRGQAEAIFRRTVCRMPPFR